MTTLVLQIPDDVYTRIDSSGGAVGEGIRLAAAFSLCERGKLSTSLAARLAGLTYVQFLVAAAANKVELFSIDPDDLSEEISLGFTLGRQRLADYPAGQSGTP